MRKKQIAVIGSGSIHKENKNYRLAEDLGNKLIESGYRILCGGKGGVMEAVCKGAKLSNNYTEGSTIGILPNLNPEHCNDYVDISIATGVSIARNQVIVASADAVIAIGGGAGTLSEIAFAWQLKKPVIALANAEGWSKKLAGEKLDNSRTDKISSCYNVQEVISKLDELLKK